MMNSYERASSEIVPAVRLALARELKDRYNLTETRIAEILGVAQAAVSKYLNGKYSDAVAEISGSIDMHKINSHIDAIANGDQAELKRCICSVCNVMNSFDCKFSSAGRTGKTK